MVFMEEREINALGLIRPRGKGRQESWCWQGLSGNSLQLLFGLEVEMRRYQRSYLLPQEMYWQKPVCIMPSQFNVCGLCLSSGCSKSHHGEL